MAPIKDMTGQRFGRTTVIRITASMRGQAAWLCRCDCGAEHVVPGGRLRRGITKSCGCFRVDFSREKMLTSKRQRMQANRKHPHYKDHLKNKVIRGAPDECWNWTGATKQGYGSLWVEGTPRLVHRVVYEIENGHEVGTIPASSVVMHKCDNPRCCNPRHLVLGTQGENNKDRAQKGRTKTLMLPGEAHPGARLDTEAVLKIRSHVGHGTGRKFAEEYGVAESTISAIRKGKSWTHL